MFDEILIMMGFMIFSIIISYALLTYTPEQLRVVIQTISIIGVVIHELCHIFMCIITNTRIENVSLVKRIKSKESRHEYQYGGEVKVRDTNISFLQALLIGIAPLYLSFWLFFFLWAQISNPHIEIWLFFTYLFVMISIFFSTAPSFTDLTTTGKAFQNDIRYSLYQILLLILSVFITWIVIISYEINITHEIFSYLTIMGVYYGLKYGFKGCSSIFYSIRMKYGDFRRPPKIKHKKYIRRRYKPAKPKNRW